MTCKAYNPHNTHQHWSWQDLKAPLPITSGQKATFANFWAYKKQLSREAYQRNGHSRGKQNAGKRGVRKKPEKWPSWQITS